MPDYGDPRLPDRFWEKVYPEPNTGCWLWGAATTHNGYGFYRVGNLQRRAHRVAYENLVGPIPDGLQLDHRCRVPSCCNPDHLDPVTGLENVRRAKKLVCKRGHRFDAENTYIRPDGRGRSCRACKRDLEPIYEKRRGYRAREKGKHGA